MYVAWEVFCFKIKKIMVKHNILEKTLLRKLVWSANSQNINYTVISRKQNAGQDHSTETGIKSLEGIAKFNIPNKTKLRSCRN
jgi:hypothetical protein